MDWNQKSSLLWDWENLAPFGASTNEIIKSVPHPESKVLGIRSFGNGSTQSSGGTLSLNSELGYASSKSSISASIDSSLKPVSRIEFNFAAVKEPDKNLGKNGDLGKVEDTGTSPSSMTVVGHEEPLIGLKLGKRTYFEDACGVNNVKSSGASVSAAPSAASVKKTRVSQQNTQNAYCQVEGCKADLSTAKNYHRKHRVCEIHSKSPKVVIAGQEHRFCQQCSRFHSLAEFDQKKRSCRRRLSDHNARRRKPPPEIISFSSSRLSTLFYDTRPQTNLLFGEAPYGQMRSNANSSWDNSGGFKFTEKASWMKPAKVAGLDGLHFPSPELSNNGMANYDDFNGLLPFRGTNAKVLNQGLEVSAVCSDSNRAPDLQHALSLLSTDSWGSPANVQPSSLMHSGITTHSSTFHPTLHALNTAPTLWHEEPAPAQQSRILAFDQPGTGTEVHEFQLTKQFYGDSSNYGH